MNIRQLKQALADYVVSPTRSTEQTIDGLNEMLDETAMFIAYLETPEPEQLDPAIIARIPHTSFAE